MKRFVTPVLLGMLGVLFGLSLWHIWIDHRDFHALLNAVVAAQRQAANAAQTAVPLAEKPPAK